MAVPSFDYGIKMYILIRFNASSQVEEIDSFFVVVVVVSFEFIITKQSIDLLLDKQRFFPITIIVAVA